MNNVWVQTDAPRHPCCERKLLIADMHPVSRTSFPAHLATGGCKLANTVDGVKGNDDDEGFYLQLRSGPRRRSDGSHAGCMSANSPDNCTHPAPTFTPRPHPPPIRAPRLTIPIPSDNCAKSPCRGSAPRAILTPISRIRCATVYASNP